MKIGFVADVKTSNGFYRVLTPINALCDGPHSARQLTDRDSWARSARGFDVLLIHRDTNEWVQRLAADAKACGAAVVWDNDDDMISITKNMPAYRILGGVKRERRLTQMKRIFQLADVVSAPNATLAEHHRKAGARHVCVIENHLPESFLQPPRRPHDGLVIGWCVGAEHHLDIERVPIRTVLQRLLDERPDVHVATFGLGLGLSSERYRQVKVVPLTHLTKEEAAFDIGIAPLSDVAINRSRSNVKLKEYSAARLPWLASPIGPYVGMGEAQGGRLVRDDGWYGALVRLLDKERDRKRLAKRAERWAATQTIEQNVGQWEAMLLKAVERARSRASTGSPIEMSLRR
jgi:hypothetical protein